MLSVTIRFSQLSDRVHCNSMACISSCNGNFTDANWFTIPIKVLMCTAMLSPYVYFSLSIFLIREVLFRAFSLSYRAKSLCYSSRALVSLATCCRSLMSTLCLIVATAFLFRILHSESITPFGISLFSIGSYKSFTIRRSSILIFQSE